MFQSNAIQKIKEHISSSITFFFENREIMWKNMEEPERPQMTIWRMRIVLHAGYLRLQTHTSEYVILIAFPPYQ